MDAAILENYKKLRGNIFLLPVGLLILLGSFLYFRHALTVDAYIAIQQPAFFALNGQLGQYPNLAYNLTQLGDCLVVFALLSVCFVYGPTLWEALLSASLTSLLLSCSLKHFFAVPRPASALDPDSFIIVGKVLTGHNSLPSGHSITIFTVLTVLLFAFMPQRARLTYYYVAGFLLLGLLLVATRVAVGAHYPLDTLFGAILGLLSGLLGIFFIRKIKLWCWMHQKRYYPVFIALFGLLAVGLVRRILQEPLPILGIALIFSIVTLFQLIKIYVKK